MARKMAPKSVSIFHIEFNGDIIETNISYVVYITQVLASIILPLNQEDLLKL